MALTLPSRSTSSTCKRNSARLDVLRLMLNDKPKKAAKSASSSSSNSPRDSLSPLGESSQDEFEERGRSRRGVDLTRPNSSSQGTPGELQSPHISFHEPEEVPETATSPPTHVNTCPPRCLTAREHRPSDLVVTHSNGLTTIPVGELKQRICDGRTEHCDSRAQVPRPKPSRRLPKTPIREIKAMGSTHSTTSSPVPDSASIKNHTKNPVHVLRKSSTNLLQRIESKSPLPPTITGTTIQVHQQVSPPAVDGSNDENDESPIDPFMDGNRPSRSPDMVTSASPVTITGHTAGQPLSASTTIRESRADTRTESRRESRMEERLESSEEVPQLPPSRQNSQAASHPLRISPAPPALSKRDSALSPTIPAPSPLPEDSPHKYGLRDRMDTPEVPEPEDINVTKARRRSSGLEIFNEARSLQSASSFLNGLSTLRRRAESAQRSTEASAWTLASYDTQRPASAARLSRPSSANPHPTGDRRRRGHNFKASGFAYTRPLTHVQTKCYKQHSRLLPSRNRIAPVECAVCHIDDDKDHYSCSWCALRMCRYCGKDFAERGIAALRQRIKGAELGSESASSSAESLGLSRGRSSFL